MEKHILGLDIGTNSIGWSVIKTNDSLANEENLLPNAQLLLAGSRIIPMDAATLGGFNMGNAQSQTKDRTHSRGVRRLIERCHLRRERLNRVLALMGFLPKHYAERLDRYGKLPEDEEPRIAWTKAADGSWQFLFKEAFCEMVADFRKKHPQLKAIPYDWTLYYLRNKALTQRVSKEELAWILHSFNAKRGYNQARGEETEQLSDKEEKYYALRVVRIEDTGEKNKGKTWYDVHLENGFVYHYPSEHKPDWEGKVREFIVTTALNADGTPKVGKDGEVKRSFRMPKDGDWALQKARTEELIANKAVGSYIYEALLSNPSQKIIGKLVRTIERRFYRRELQMILQKQAEFHKELNDREFYEACTFTLYPHNEGHRRNLASRNFTHLLIEDILFYQRPLKSKKSLIDNCPYEYHTYKNKDKKQECRVPLKCIARSHPLFQEFRLRQFISNLRIFRREAVEQARTVFNLDVTEKYLPDDAAYEELYGWLSTRPDVTQKELLKHFKLKDSDYRWNYIDSSDKAYPAGETRALIIKYLKKAGLGSEVLTAALEERLWHLLYSVSNCDQLRSGLRKLAENQGWPDAATFADVFVKFPPFPSAYGAYSAKATRKLLSLMRRGDSWREENIPAEVRLRIDHLLTGEWDESISNRVREKALHFEDVTDFQGLPLWLACYVAYDRHSEAADTQKWTSPADIDTYLKHIKQHSLRNPIVEQALMETLRTVRDIRKTVGHIDEIHVEMGREMKRTAKEREQDSNRIIENENTNLRIKALLMEFMNPEFGVEGVRPYSPSQQEILRIYEEQVLENASKEDLESYASVIKGLSETDMKKRPTTAEVLRYRLWLEQKYRSPYTGQPIPLAKLFTPAYEIEHIIPQSLFFDNSQSNKVICESEVNKLKGNSLGMAFISNNEGCIVTCSGGRQVKIFTALEYKAFINDHYAKNPQKRRKLLMEELPQEFSARQMNDSRYVSRAVLAPLSHIVRQKEENGEYEQALVSKNVVVCTGQVTDRLKRDWGLGDVWNRIIEPRFRRLNEREHSNRFGHEAEVDGKRFFRIEMPLELQRGFSRKRIDHRHHAMDAIVVACATRNVVNYLNNCSAADGGRTTRDDLKHLLCRKGHRDANGNYQWLVRKPWDTFTEDTQTTLQRIVVSFKQNLRVINCCTNYFRRFNPKRGKFMLEKQDKGDRLAIRKSLHKATVYGLVNLRSVKAVRLSKALECPERIVDGRIKAKVFELKRMKYSDKLIEKHFKENRDALYGGMDMAKIEVYVFSSDAESTRMVAGRKPLDKSFNQKKIASVTDTGIQKILLHHLEACGGNAEVAFSPDGIEQMNANICHLNGGKAHQPIYRVRVSEVVGNKFVIGHRGNRASKYVVADEGTNLFFAAYQKADGTRAFATIQLNEAIERMKQRLDAAPQEDEHGNRLLFTISPNDLVYIPTEEERDGYIELEGMDRSRIYKMVSCSANRCWFIAHAVSSAIVDKYEYTSQNKVECTDTGESIKNICVPLWVDRLGRIQLK